jgi:hypothetical protein
MSVNLTYQSNMRIPDDVKARVQAAAAKLNESPGWWCEGINFFDDPLVVRGGALVSVKQEGRLIGSTKMFFGGGYHAASGEYVDVEFADDKFMATRDALRIVDQLAGWSREHGLDWELSCAGETVGHITRGQSDERLGAFLKELADTAALRRPDVEVASEAGERLARELDAKYASRWP